MSAAPSQVTLGVHVLRHLLREQTIDLRSFDLAGFRGWLNHHLARWQHDPVFVQRTRIRDLRRAHPELRVLEREHRRAAHAEVASPHSGRLRRLTQELINTDRAIAGLTAALKGALPERRPGLRQKLKTFQAKQRELQEEKEKLQQTSRPWQTWQRLDTELRQIRSTIGLEQKEAVLDRLLKQQGRRSGQSGKSFEQQARTITCDVILPDLLRGSSSAEAIQRVRILRGVTLGAARTEFDQLVIRQPRRPGWPVEVLAVVEVKRNLNDLARGFRQRQENLAWLTGDTGHYDAAQYRTRQFSSGHFDREAQHQEEGEIFSFTRKSFHRFRRDPATDLILDRLYFITRGGPMWGVSSEALSRIRYRVATDRHGELHHDGYLRQLLGWCQTLTEPIETPDVLQVFASSPRRAKQILVVHQ